MTIKLVMEAYPVSDDYFGDGPEWAEASIDESFLQKLKHLSETCKKEGWRNIALNKGPDRWDREDDYTILDDATLVFSNMFWFEGYPKHSNHTVETREIKIDALRRAVDAVMTGNNNLPPYFAIDDGILYYSLSDVEGLIETYKNRDGDEKDDASDF